MQRCCLVFPAENNRQQPEKEIIKNNMHDRIELLSTECNKHRANLIRQRQQHITYNIHVTSSSRGIDGRSREERGGADKTDARNM
jgi:hypothetical protein